jgi:aromatic amino acid aminotransferase I
MIRGRNPDHRKEKSGTNSTAVMSCERGESSYDLDIALNYGGAVGSPQVLRFITEHVEMIHRPVYDDWETCLTCGTTSAIEIVLRMLCNSGDCILAEAYTYSGAIEVAKALGLNILGMEMDDLGLLPEDLDSKLRSWDVARGPKPSVLYTIPSGQNPTGTTQTTQRRKAIYRVAELHGQIIIEDDPYYFIQLGESGAEIMDAEGLPTSPQEYLDHLPVSYLSMDSAGRVLRLDSTSKILAPGLRLGWMTGCSQLVEKFLSYTEFSTVSPSGPSQVMLYKLLDETWGHEGLI